MEADRIIVSASSTTAVPSIDQIRRVTAITAPVIRNLQITDTYRQLSFAFVAKTGMKANWCTFATWASKQAGVTIRREDLQRAIELRLRNEPAVAQILALIYKYSTQIGKGIIHENIHENALAKIVRASAARAADAVARGNKKVFEEIGFEFARFISNCINHTQYDADSINQFINELRPGPPPDGQEMLKEAFLNYYNALFEHDQKKRDELMFHANILVGVHEQTRLQPEISEALTAGKIDVEELKKYLTDLLVYNKTWKGKFLYFVNWVAGKTNLLKESIDRFTHQAQAPIREVITEHLMTLNLPANNCIHLGRDLTMQYPSTLQTLNNDKLIALLTQLKPNSHSYDGQGCDDWSNLQQRIFFIANLFRCYQDTPDLFNEAFNEQQLRIIRAGNVPKGNL